MGHLMKRGEVLRSLGELLPEIVSRFAVRELFLFGSVARDEAREDSDIDILVDFEGPATFDGYMDLVFLLEEALGARVDLVTKRALREELKPYVEQDAVRVA